MLRRNSRSVLLSAMTVRLDSTVGRSEYSDSFLPLPLMPEAAMAAGRAEALRGSSTLNQKDLKRFKKILEETKKNLLLSARKTLSEEAAFDTDDLPDEIDLASSEYTQSM